MSEADTAGSGAFVGRDGRSAPGTHPAVSRRFAALPKAHLHVHLEAAMRESTLREWCAEDGLPVPPLVEYPDFTEFLDAYGVLIALLRTPDRIERLLDEVVADAAAQGVVALEFATIPERSAAFAGGGGAGGGTAARGTAADGTAARATAGGGTAARATTADAALECILAAAADAGRRHGVWTGAIVSIDRGAGPEHALESARLAARWADRGVVALGLVADERGNPVAGAAEAFAVARDAGLAVVPHAGELAGPEEVRSAVELGASRIQHGVRAEEDPAVVELLAESGVCLDVCPTSNVVLGVSPSLAEHPLPHLLGAGVRCSLGADDPVLFGTDVADEYVRAHESMGLPESALVGVARASVECSFAPAEVRRAALAGIDAWERGTP